ncbi:MAG: Rab family GTPase [Candidatus Hodarchaeales archaeon]|jgi:small GTP-binding protein
MSDSNTKSPIALKILLLGDSTVGKTTLKNTYIGTGFKTDLLPTLGADFASKTINFKDKSINFQIWDIGGQESFSQVRKAFYGGAVGGIILYDISEKKSFDNVKYWIHEFQNHSGPQSKSIILIGNKIDLRESENTGLITKEEGQLLAKELSKTFQNSIIFYETSALTGENIEKVFDSISEFHIKSS